VMTPLSPLESWLVLIAGFAVIGSVLYLVDRFVDVVDRDPVVDAARAELALDRFVDEDTEYPDPALELELPARHVRVLPRPYDWQVDGL
jgi:hypothetical protein